MDLPTTIAITLVLMCGVLYYIVYRFLLLKETVKAQSRTIDRLITLHEERFAGSGALILDELLTIIDEYLEHLYADVESRFSDAPTTYETGFAYGYPNGVDSARAVIEFYLEKLEHGEKAQLAELLARGRTTNADQK